MAPMRAFSVVQKRSKIAKLTPNDLFSLYWNTEENWTNHSFSFLKFIIFYELLTLSIHECRLYKPSLLAVIQTEAKFELEFEM